MHTHISFGSKDLSILMPASTEVLTIREPELLITPELFSTIITNHLKTKTFDLSSTIIVVADKTRVCGYPTYLPLLIEVLKDNGMAEKNLRFIIAYGTHPPQSEEECLKSYGSIYNSFSFTHHNCKERNGFVDCGTTSSGTPIRFRKDIFQASCVITMGPICHHYFAGYGGGRKLIFPGCGEREAIYANHGLYLDREKKLLSTCCQPGVLPGNPIAQDLFEIEDKKPADIAIHGIMNSHGQLSDILIGAGRDAFIEACTRHGGLCEYASDTFPVVIASCGGFPKDINFIQSHKAIHNSSMFVEDGGTLIIYGECRDGIGSETFLPWFDAENFETAFHHLSCGYQGNGGTALAMMTKTQRIKIVMVTELEDSICDTIGVEKWNHEKVLGFLKKCTSSIGFIPNASLLVRKLS